MLFNSFAFVVFLSIVLLLYYSLEHKWQNRMLLAASYVFYGAWAEAAAAVDADIRGEAALEVIASGPGIADIQVIGEELWVVNSGSGFCPGQATAEYLHRVLNRITLTGALFLGAIAVLPFVVQGVTNLKTLTIGGTGILIVVSVVIEIMKQIESQMVMRDYEKFY